MLGFNPFGKKVDDIHPSMAKFVDFLKASENISDIKSIEGAENVVTFKIGPSPFILSYKEKTNWIELIFAVPFEQEEAVGFYKHLNELNLMTNDSKVILDQNDSGEPFLRISSIDVGDFDGNEFGTVMASFLNDVSTVVRSDAWKKWVK